jgi:hypothetical protein
MSPRSHDELLGYVAFCGTKLTKIPVGCDLEGVVLKAASAARQDPALTRMLPTFLWRVRMELDMESLLKRVSKLLAPTLDYFLEVAGKLGSYSGFNEALEKLRLHVLSEPEYFFPRAHENPFSALLAEERTPSDARKWGFLTGTPMDSFQSYFDKVAGL